MNLSSLQKRSYHLLLGLMFALTFVFSAVENAYSQAENIRPKLPVLSLTGAADGYDENIYPDGRIWLPPSQDGTREFLLPVFINNKWAYYRENPNYIPDAIYSFKFKLLYDSTAFLAVGYEKDLHPTILPDLPFANEFTIDFKDEKDRSWVLRNGEQPWGDVCNNYVATEGKTTSYHFIRLDPCHGYTDLENGRVATIVGSSSKPLPNTTLDGEEYKVLIYVRFKVLASQKSESPIILDDREIRYNDVNIRNTYPFSTTAGSFTLGKTTKDQIEIQRDYKIDFNTGLQGIDNKLTELYDRRPSRKGVVWVYVTDMIPAFDMSSIRGGEITRPQLDNVNNEDKLWILQDPITVDTKGTRTKSMPTTYTIGSRKLKLMNKVSGTRMLGVKIESNQPWLEFRRVNANGQPVKDPNWVTTSDNWIFDDRIKGIDNNILGNVDYPDPSNNPTKFSDDYGPVYLEFRINKDKLTEVQNPNREAIYTGFLSFTAPSAKYSSVQLKVTGILFKDPNEGGTGTGLSSIPGARVWVRNARPDGSDDTVMLVFGTGARATAGVDTLYGEYAYPATPAFNTINQLAARWFGVTAAQKAAFPNGLGDWLPNDEYKYSSSRDIRDENDTTESLVYNCKFRRNSNDKNIVIEWDPRDFIPGSRCFLRDTLNGNNINVNMLEGTVNPTSGRHSYTTSDMNFNSFNIEYTPPRTIRYLDENKQPIIKTGWNLLSLPVRPVTPDYKVMYPNTVGIPYEFNGTGFQQADNLIVGKGYFMKYAVNLDDQFTGSMIRKIEYPTDEVIVYPDTKANQGAWNLIGGLSTPANVNDISFTQYNVNGVFVSPTVNYTRKNGVWGYKSGKGYVQVTELVPGLGYFIKCDNYGYLRIIPAAKRFATEENTTTNNISINVRDNAANETSIYLAKDKSIDINGLEMPPAFDGMFDVRFSNNYNVSNSDNSVFTLRGVSYPVEITMENTDADYTFVDAATKQVLGTIAKGTTSNVVIASARTNTVEVLKSNVETTEVYPNPAVNEVKVSFNKATSGSVVMSLVDMFGNTLDTQIAVKGTATFNVSNLSTGKYFCKIVAGDYNETVSVTVVR